jgi:excisionase family DNA binding protein
MPKLTVSIAEACSMLGIGKTTLYVVMAAGKLDRCKIGRRTLVTVASIERLIVESIDL